MAKKQSKGDVGKGTGAATRRAIKTKVNQGATLDQIGKKTNRDASTIGAILGGRIKNPPKGLASQISKTKAPAKKPAGKPPKGTKSTAAFRKHR
jgi:hypothetical protein